ncbi:filamentous hemagglutinin N-terminal domain-containing protein [Calothrix sp. FACHB-1219]|uniref:two-partner secretion domain-containing protein n=1 Tax=unclassified Calothrix TaxID=2619626 RepID=UPI0016835766|nr:MULTISPECIES: filamentous hemagglutinin N-terminal domain-containing protein [unclassified Calothrix]MBD2201911.1 filamentous hemagglutinin N-terminal domain-containing protein [Calothrix sp. FACHB-168]MBD2216946.1 filamentous hemagglutinin N-terminal domain-containing protein [Calothrix sp. FACHB-1219]
MPNAQCPKRRGGCPSPPTRGWSFPPLSINLTFKSLRLVRAKNTKPLLPMLKNPLIIALLTFLGTIFTISDRTFAQVIPDNSLGTKVESLNPQIDQITGGSQRGANLFHSFSEFNIDAGRGVYFQNPHSVTNILTRITGNNPSQIFGTLGVLGNANLFLLNPNGIIFGENARLDISGSFFASTAKSLVFDNGLEFNTTNPEAPPLLTLKIRPGLQNGIQGNISNAGNLTVGTGQSLTLLGNTVTSTGTITAPGGRVEIFGDRIGLLDNAKIEVSAVGGGGTVLIGGDFQGKGTVPNASSTFIGKNTSINADAIDNGNGGRVIVWSDNNTRFYGNISARGGVNSGNGGFVEVSGKQSLDYNGLVDTNATNGNIGTLLLDPTNIEIVAAGGETLNLTDADAFSDTDIGGDGNTKILANAFNFALANVTLQATENITFSAPVITYFPGVGITAEAGNNIFVNNQIISNGGQIQLNTQQGDITINANVISLGGNLGINTKNLTLNQGILSANNSAATTVGNMKITAVESINIIGEGSKLISNNFGAIAGGNLEIETGTLNILDGALLGISTINQETAGNLTINAKNSINIIGTGVIDGSGISTQNIGTNNGGNLSVFTEKLLVQDAAIIATLGVGSKAGNLSIQARESIDVINQGAITSVSPQGNGAAGDISIETKNLNLQNRSSLASSSIASLYPSGKVTIRAQESINIDNLSFLSSTSIGSGNAGELNLFTGTLTISNKGNITSQTVGTANGGNINLYADNSVNLIQGGQLSTSAFGTGSAGNVYIETQKLNMLAKDSFITTSSTDVPSIYQFLQNPELAEVAQQIELLPPEMSKFLFESLEAGNTQSNIQGNAGNLTIRATESVNIANNAGASTSGTGKASGGTIFIDTRQLNLENQSNIITNILGSGNAGFLHIRASDAITASGNSKIYTVAQRDSTGNAGGILLQTDNLAITDRADVSSATLGSGEGGDIQVQANSLFLTNTGRLNSLSEGTGNAGDIFIDITDQIQGNQGQITATSILSGGGNINIKATDIRLRNSSEITTSVFNGTGGGGNIDVRSQVFVVLEDSDILANADAGPGGNITINAPAFIAQFSPSGRNPGDFSQFRGNGEVDISADSRLGQNGEVVINSIDPSRGLAALPQVPVDSQIAEGCYSPTQTQGKFIITGRGGLPSNPTDILNPDTVQVDWVRLKPKTENSPTASINNQTAISTIPQPLIEATGWLINEKGQLTLSANLPTTNPNHHSQQPATCNTALNNPKN